MPNLITIAEIVAACTIEKNLDDRRITSFIPIAQLQRLRPALGVTLYNALIAAVDAVTDEAPLDAPWPALIETARPMLCWWTVALAWPQLLVHLTNAGVTMRTGRESSSADVKAADGAQVSYTDTAELYTGELRTWLEAHRADYAAWLPTAANDIPSEPHLVGGVYFG